MDANGRLDFFLWIAIYFIGLFQSYFRYGLEDSILLEIHKLELVQIQFINSDKYERILLLQPYYNQLIFLESLERKIRMKNIRKRKIIEQNIADRMQVFQKYYGECELALYELDRNKLENQKYFLAYSDIQLSFNQENYFSTKDSESRFLSLSFLVKDVIVINNKPYLTLIPWFFLYCGCTLYLYIEGSNPYIPPVLLGIFSIWFWIARAMTDIKLMCEIKLWKTLGFFWGAYGISFGTIQLLHHDDNTLLFLVISVLTSFSVMIVMSLLQKLQRKSIQEVEIDLKDKIRGLKNSSISVVSHIDVLQLLIQSEQQVQGIEPLMVSQISFYVNKIMTQWNTYNKMIDAILHLVKKRFYLVIPVNPYGYIEQTIINEREKGRQDFLSIQETIKSWITTHMKDLQNHQQEIQQIHQSLLQNKNENAEVIALLEKNFNLHLQSAQKVENSI